MKTRLLCRPRSLLRRGGGRWMQREHEYGHKQPGQPGPRSPTPTGGSTRPANPAPGPPTPSGSGATAPANPAPGPPQVTPTPQILRVRRRAL